MKPRKKKRNIKGIVFTHIINNLKEYVSVILVFFIGIVIGVIAINNSNAEQVSQINDYINMIQKHFFA